MENDALLISNKLQAALGLDTSVGRVVVGGAVIAILSAHFRDCSLLPEVECEFTK